MLSESPIGIHSGGLRQDILLKAGARYELIGFIAEQLPPWRDEPERPPASAERKLTDHLCDYLNTAVRYSEAWSNIQFRTEVPDEVHSERSIDLAAKPCQAVIIIEGNKYNHHNMLLPIECKRLPTPDGNGQKRDKREYVYTANKTTGGIQRFKCGYHSSKHSLAAMIGFVQEGTAVQWHGQVNSWIRGLAKKSSSGLTKSDVLTIVNDNTTVGLCILKSCHQRPAGMGACELRHLWVKMN